MAATPVGELSAGAGEPTLDEMRERVASRFRSVARSAEDLRSEVHATTDWRTQTARHPWWTLGAAAGVGLLVAKGLLRRRRRHGTARLVRAATERLGGLADGHLSLRPVSRPSGHASPLLRGLVGILAGEAVRRVGRRLKTDPSFRAGLSEFLERRYPTPDPRDAG